MAAASEEAIKQLSALMEQLEEPLKTTFQHVHQGYPRQTLVRFLKAREWTVPKAHKMLMDSLNWRLQNEIDTVLAKPIVPSDLYRSIPGKSLVLTGYSKQNEIDTVPAVSAFRMGRLPPAVLALIKSWVPPELSSTLTDGELVEKYLRPVLQHKESTYMDILSGWRARKDVASNPAVVNAGLPSMSPWELPVIMAGKQGRREKYYLTDHHMLCFMSDYQINTPNGFWIRKGSSYADRLQMFDDRSMGMFKKTYIWKDTSRCVGGIESNWTMNVYSLMNGQYIEEELVLCHVFEGSPDYGAKPNRHTFVQGGCRCSGEHHHERINASTSTLFNSISQASSQIQHGSDWRPDPPELTSFMADLENFMLCDPDPDSSMETGHCRPTRGVSPIDDRGSSHKRKKKSSDVWDYFTKIYAHDLEGNVVTLAACNHCSKVLTGSSKGGTTHLARHACPCKLKPVQAARMDKGAVNVLSSQAISACS